MQEWDHRDSRPVDQVMGAFFLMPRPLFEQLGGFDERFFLYFEDVDFAWRAQASGRPCHFLAEVTAFHKGGGTSEQVKPERIFYCLRSRIIYARKHFGWGRAAALTAVTILAEPLSRLALAVASGRPSVVVDTIKAYRLLYADLPRILNTPPPASAMRVLLLTRYGRLGATSRQRHLLFLPALAEAGISVTVDALLDDAYVRGMHAGVRPRPGAILAAYAARIRRLLAARDWDVLWIEKELLPWLPALAEGWLARCRVPMVVDYDDAWFHRYDRHPRPLVRRLLGRKIDRVMAAATTVVAGNRYIADHARRAGASRVEIVPTVVDTDALGTTPAPAGRPSPSAGSAPRRMPATSTRSGPRWPASVRRRAGACCWWAPDRMPWRACRARSGRGTARARRPTWPRWMSA